MSLTAWRGWFRTFSSGVLVLVVVSVLPAQVSSARSATPGQPRFALLERAIAEEMRDRGIPGVAVVVIENGEVTFRRAYGIADVESGAPMSTELLVQVGSVTKVVTALAATAMQLRGEVDLDVPIAHYITGLAPRIGGLTLRALLSQVSGLRDEPADSGRQDVGALLEYARSLPDAAQQLPSGVAFSYSNLGYALAGLALQEAVHRPYASLVNERVLRPLLMGHATLRPLDAATYPRAAGHAQDSTGRLRIVRPIANDTRYWPAGYLWASVDDLALLLQALINRGPGVNTPSQLAAAADSMLVPRVEAPGLPHTARYGFGMFLDEWHGARRAWHPGSMPGNTSLLEFLPNQKIGVVVVANRDAVRLDRIAETALETLTVLPGDGAESGGVTAAPIPEAQLQSLEGSYVGRFPLELTFRDGHLLLHRLGAELPVTPLGNDRYSIQPRPSGDPEVFRISPQLGGRPAFIQMFLWSFPRVRAKGSAPS